MLVKGIVLRPVLLLTGRRVVASFLASRTLFEQRCEAVLVTSRIRAAHESSAQALCQRELSDVRAKLDRFSRGGVGPSLPPS